MNTFDSFKECLKDLIINTYKISYDDIYYVALTDSYWISFIDFMELNKIPKVWDTFSFKKDQFGHFDGLPSSFKIVLKDYRWIEYDYNWGDSYYSKFIMCTPPKKPQRKYYERKEPHKATLADFMFK